MSLHPRPSPLVRAALLCALAVGICPAALGGGPAVDIGWDRLCPQALKECEPVQLPRNPLQQARATAAPRPVPVRLKKELILRLKRQLEEQVRGVVRVEGRSLLLLGGKVCQVGQEIPLQAPPGANASSVLVRIKSLEAGRLVLLLSEPEAEENTCEEWVYALPEFLGSR